MSFLSPLYLIGLLSAAIPLLIHLSRSRRTRTLRFSTTRFLTDQFLRSYRMSRLKELLLLAARMALCALLASTFARPFLEEGVQEGDASASRSVVIVLDDSASMHYRDAGGETLLSRAAREAAKIIADLKPSDSAAIVLAGRRAAGPLAEFREPTTDSAAVQASLLGIAEMANSARGMPHALGTDIAGAVLAADRMLGKVEDVDSHEIYVFSDLQARGLSEPALAGETQASFDARVTIVPIQPTEPISNLAVTAVQYGASRPMAGIPFSIRPHVRNDGQQPRSCIVSLYVKTPDGSQDADEEGYRKVAERQIKEPIEPGRWGVLTLHHTFYEGGWQSGYVAVEDERLTADNRRYFSFEVLEAVSVIAINGAPSSVARNDELFFLNNALAAGGSNSNPITVIDVRPNAFQAAPLDKVQLVVMANVETLPEASVAKLERYVGAGGSLLVFLGDQVQPGFYNSFLANPKRPLQGLLPATIEGAVPRGDLNSDEPSAVIGDFAGDHPALGGFESRETGTLGGVTFRAWWGLRLARTGDSRVVMQTDKGDPLLCERSYGKGRVSLFASSCDRDWTNFPVKNSFLPFIYRLVGYLAQEASGQQEGTTAAAANFYRTGQLVLNPIPVGGNPASLPVIKPDRTEGVFSASSDPTARRQEFGETDQPGIYRIKGTGRTFAVNLEAGESDLATLAGDEAAGEELRRSLTWVDQKRLTIENDPTQLSQQAGRGRGRSTLWETLLWIVLAIALLEPLLANWITLQHYLKRRTDPKSVPIPTGRVTLGGDLDEVTAAAAATERRETDQDSSSSSETREVASSST